MKLKEDEGVAGTPPTNSMGTHTMAANDIQLPMTKKVLRRRTVVEYAKTKKKLVENQVKNVILICETADFTHESS